jgi:hypothetical protein
MVTKVAALLTAGIGATILLLGLLMTLVKVEGASAGICAVPSNYSTIQSAVSNKACNIVEVDAGRYLENITITRTVTIQGQGVEYTTIDGSESGRVFIVVASSSLTLKNLTVANGQSPNSDPFELQTGAGIFIPNGHLVLSETKVINNRSRYGAGISIDGGTLLIQASSISANVTDKGNRGGAGLFINGKSDVRIIDSIISHNYSNQGGGGIRIAKGTLTISNTLFLENDAENGSAIDNSRIHYDEEAPTVYIYDSSFVSNTSGYYSAAISNEGSLTLVNSKVISHTGRGIDNGADMLVTHSEISGNKRGGILNRGIMTVTESIFEHNQADINGGAIVNGTYPSTDPQITIIDSIFKDNETNSRGGAIYNTGWLGSRVIISNSQFVHNLAMSSGGSGYGGAIANDGGYMTIDNSSMFNNQSGFAGGVIYNTDGGELFVTNSTISHNYAGQSGGAVLNQSPSLFVLRNSTVCYNQAKFDGDALHSGWSNESETRIVNSIIAANGSDNCGGPFDFQSLGNNVFSDSTCDPISTDITNTHIVLFPSSYNDGQGLVYELLPGSVAIDTGSIDHCPTIDQRSAWRPLDGDLDGRADCDIGAYEFDPANPPDIDQLFLPSILIRQVPNQ